jgi:hypothetical protein
VARQVVSVDAKERGVELLERRLLITEAAGFKRSARGVVLWVEKQDDIPPLQIGETHRFAVRSRCQLEIGGWLPRSQQFSHDYRPSYVCVEVRA